RFEHLECLDSIPGREDAIAAGLHHHHPQLAQHLFVLHQHDGARAVVEPTRPAPTIGFRLARGGDRQIDAYGGAVTRLTLDLDKATMVIDHAIDDGKTETGSFAPFLCRIERFENVMFDLFADARASVDDANEDVTLGGHAAENLLQFSSLRYAGGE